MEVFYFGGVAQLFGCYHEPGPTPGRDCGIVLCYPMGQEYIRAHRAFRQLAILLSQSGFPVLRFDFFGCGDSSGDDNEGTIRQWLADISTAVEELISRSGCTRVCLIGLRLGGTLAALAGADRGDVDRMILWDPVVSGRLHAQELSSMHREQMQQFIGESPADKNHIEILGFLLNDTVLEDLNKLDLLAIRQKPADRVLVVESSEGFPAEPFVARLKSLSARVAYEHVTSPKIWIRHEEYSLLVPTEVLQFVTSWMSEEVCS